MTATVTFSILWVSDTQIIKVWAYDTHLIFMGVRSAASGHLDQHMVFTPQILHCRGRDILVLIFILDNFH